MSTTHTTLEEVIRVRELLRSGEFARIRDRAGMTKSEIAHVLGVHAATYGRWENDAATPIFESCIRLSELLRVLER